MRLLQLFLFYLLLMTNVDARGFKKPTTGKLTTSFIQKPLSTKRNTSLPSTKNVKTTGNGALETIGTVLGVIGYAVSKPNAKIHGNRHDIEND